MANLFVEHRFSLADNTLDITPGVSVNYFSDFKFHAFPGVDVGYAINDAFKAMQMWAIPIECQPIPIYIM